MWRMDKLMHYALLTDGDVRNSDLKTLSVWQSQSRASSLTDWRAPISVCLSVSPPLSLAPQLIRQRLCSTPGGSAAPVACQWMLTMRPLSSLAGFPVRDVRYLDQALNTAPTCWLHSSAINSQSTSHIESIRRLTLWRQLLPYRYSYKASCVRPD